MNTRLIAIIALTSAVLSNVARASDLERLARNGYGVALTTQVNGEFEGCDFGKRIRLMNGLVFQCQTYAYHYSYMPEVLIVKSVHDGSLKVLIDGDEYDGTLYR